MTSLLIFFFGVSYLSFLFSLRMNITVHILLFSAGVVYLYLRSIYSYWDKLGVPSSKPCLIVGDTLRRLGITTHRLEFCDDLYYNSNGRDFCGMYEFLNPTMMVGNLELIKRITAQDFDHFSTRKDFHLAKVNPIADEMLANATGDKWRQIRSSVSPLFTSHKMKQLYPFICQQSDEFVRLLEDKATQESNLDMRELCGQFTMETIASCAFGIECQAMNADRATFAEMASKIFLLSPVRAFKIIILLIAPFLARWGQMLGIEFSSDEFYFFGKIVSETLRWRSINGITRGDFLDFMKETNKLSETTMAAQSVLFLLAGHNNTASLMSFAMHLLAMNQDVQQRLRKELVICESQEGEDTECEILQKLPLLDCVIKETLRLYPTDPDLERTCTKDYRIPGTDLTIHKGQSIIIPIWSIHRDPSYWPQPDAFIPERFLDPDNLYSNAYLPFGNGPRRCIGIKFAYLVAKVGIQKVLRRFHIVPSSQTVHPPPLSPRCFLTTHALNGIPLALIPLPN